MVNDNEKPEWCRDVDYTCSECADVHETTVEESITLGLVDIKNNRNSYYRIQLLKSFACTLE